MDILKIFKCTNCNKPITFGWEHIKTENRLCCKCYLKIIKKKGGVKCKSF